jgi:hypothetical protein
MSDRTTCEAFSDNLYDLVCKVCDQPFDVGELRSHMIILKQGTKPVTIWKHDGVPTTLEVTANEHIVLHANGCRQEYAMRSRNSFEAALRHVKRKNETNDDDNGVERHGILYNVFRFYEKAFGEHDRSFKVAIHPTLQATDPVSPSAIFKFETCPGDALPVLDRGDWKVDDLSMFLQTITEVEVSIHLGLNTGTKAALHQIADELQTFQESVTADLQLQHEAHIWMQITAIAEPSRTVRAKLILFQRPDEQLMTQLHRVFQQTSESVHFTDLVLDSSLSSVSTFASDYRKMHASMKRERTMLLKAMLFERPWSASTEANGPSMTSLHDPFTVFASSVRYESSSMSDHYTVRYNNQETSSIGTFYTVRWDYITDKTRVPTLVILHGMIPESGIPFELHDMRVLHDLSGGSGESYMKHEKDAKAVKIV